MKRFIMASVTMMFILSVVYVIDGMSADVPKTLNYQGDLTDNTGQPVSGTKSIKFSLYDVVSGGTALWTETQTVTLTNGHFSVVLGNITTLDTSKFGGTTYIGIKVGTDAEMAPRQKFTSVAYALKALDVVNQPIIPDPIPSGFIGMWSGSAASIPSGWALCDGVERTLPNGSKVTPPNLKDKFIVGAGGTLPTAGGSSNHTHSITAETPGTNSTGAHTHHLDVNLYSCIGDCTDGAEDGDKDVASESHGHHLVADTASNGAHAHTVNSHSHSGNTGSFSTLPPYYALCFIMRL